MSETAPVIPDDAVEITEADIVITAGVDEDPNSLIALGVEPKRIEQHKKYASNWAKNPRADALWKTFTSPAEILEYAAEVGADMQMGLYVDGQGRRWKPRQPMLVEIMRHLGYGVAYAKFSHRPAWWPERGSLAFYEYVDLKVNLRRQTGMVKLEQIRPFMESLVGLAVIELTRRLKLNPEKVSTRDLADIISRTTARLSHGSDLPVNPDGVPKSAEGRTVFLAIIEQAQKSLPEGIARDQMLRLFQEHLDVAQQSVPAIMLTPPKPGAKHKALHVGA